VKSKLQRSRDVDRAYEELAERLHKVPGVTSLGEWGDGLAYRVRGNAGLTAIIEVELHDGQLWLHLSVSARLRVPSWDELRWCKDVFMGDVKAITVFPKKAEYVNDHPRTLHLFAPLEQDPLPDFRAQCAVLGRVSR
jgi:hypothetical protein